jgi:triphosphoribosyl-dephospho-CoA synthase
VTSDARRAYLWACALDVAVRKPGNVSIASAGHGMHAEQFITSAIVSADALCERGAPVGRRIEGAIEATRAAVACNTNLGIVLLCAPLFAACENLATATIETLRAQLGKTLAALDVEDARAAYRAIAQANRAVWALLRSKTCVPRRLRSTCAPRCSLRPSAIGSRVSTALNSLMFSRPAWKNSCATPHKPATAMLACYLEFLATGVDSHIVRKHGAPLAHTVTTLPRTCLDAWRATGKPPRADALAAWDESLKAAASTGD